MQHYYIVVESYSINGMQLSVFGNDTEQITKFGIFPKLLAVKKKFWLEYSNYI